MATRSNENAGNSLASKQNRHLIDRLRSLGLGQYVALPQIVAMGDTSSGKSSVLSALSGITFPSSDKLTTRCPTELILSNNPVFSGSVYLQRYKGAKEEEVKLDSPEMITKEIERLTKMLVGEGQHISDDSIIVTAQGPEYPDLTLTDLPGLVRTVSDGEDRSIISSVSTLVQRYMDRPRTIILAVHPANIDLHNSEILESAQKADPEGLRTICVMTKLDLVDQGAEDTVIDILKNESIKVLNLGYHAVKCRGQKALKNCVTIEQAKKEESVFFESHQKWNVIDKSLVGIDNLGRRLVVLLEETIARALPHVIAEISLQIEDCMKKIEKTGVALDSDYARRRVYSALVDKYLHLIKSAFNGDYSSSEFFNPPENPELENRHAATLYKLDMEFSAKMAECQFKETHKHPNHECKIGDMVEVWINGVWKSEKVSKIDEKKAHSICSTRAMASIVFHDSSAPCNSVSWRHKPILDLTNLKQLILDNHGPELSIFPSYNVFCSIVRTFVDQWKALAASTLKNYYEKTNELSERAINEVCESNVSLFFKYKTSEVFRRIKIEAEIKLTEAISQELDPQTLNHYLEDVLTKLRNKDLLDALEAVDSQNFNKELVISLLKSHGVGTMCPEDRQALEMFWALTAYTKVSRKRFTDRVPQTLKYCLIKNFETQIKNELCVGDAELGTLLIESPSVVNYRIQLGKKMKALELSKLEIMKM
jgi:GTPase SAR1 family protein